MGGRYNCGNLQGTGVGWVMLGSVFVFVCVCVRQVGLDKGT